MKKGFTLVELSIVLVIIGLLTGGILAGRSLILSARISKAVSDMNQYVIATTSFETIYKALPGDSNALSPQGNEDGRLTFTEAQNFFPHLSQGVDLKTSSGQDYVTLSGVPTVNKCPRLDLDQRKGPLAESSLGAAGPGDVCFSAFTADITTESRIFTYTMVHGSNSTGTGDVTGDPLTSRIASALDKKMDDGLPNTGKLRAWSDYMGHGNTSASCVVSGQYNNASRDYICSLLLRY